MSARLQKTWRDIIWASGLVGIQSFAKDILLLHWSLGKSYRTLEGLAEEWEVEWHLAWRDHIQDQQTLMSLHGEML